MMNSLVRPILVLALAAAAVPAAAQPGAARERAEAERARGERMRGPQAALREDAERRAFDMLLRHRHQLELSDQQVRELETIRARLEQQNAPLRQRLLEQHQRLQAERRAQLERMSPEQRRAELRRLRREGRPGVPQELQPTVRQMRLNINDAVHQAQGVLTAEQRLRAQALLRRAAAPARRPGMRGAEGRRPRRELERRERLREPRRRQDARQP